MPSAISSIFRASTRRQEDRLNILTYSTHERYQSNLANCNANFYLISTQSSITWNRSYCEPPTNHLFIKGELPPDIDFDLILSQNKPAHFPTSHQLSRQLHLPICCLEHCTVIPGSPPSYIQQMKSMRGHTNVFISEFSRKEWGWGENEADVVHHGINSDLFSPGAPPSQRTPHLLSVVNDWVNRDRECGFTLWRASTEGLPVKVYGKTPGLSEPAPSPEALAEGYRTSRVFLNTSLVSPIPTALLEGMACGCACVSTATAMIPEIIEHGVNGLLANTPEEIRGACQLLLENNDLADRLGEAARRTIVERFSLDAFVKNWDRIFQKTAAIPYLG